MQTREFFEITYLIDEQDCDVAYVRAETAQEAELRFEEMYPDFTVVHIEPEEV